MWYIVCAMAIDVFCTCYLISCTSENIFYILNSSGHGCGYGTGSGYGRGHGYGCGCVLYFMPYTFYFTVICYILNSRANGYDHILYTVCSFMYTLHTMYSILYNFYFIIYKRYTILCPNLYTLLSILYAP